MREGRIGSKGTHLVVLVDKVEATVVGDEGGDCTKQRQGARQQPVLGACPPKIAV